MNSDSKYIGHSIFRIFHTFEAYRPALHTFLSTRQIPSLSPAMRRPGATIIKSSRWPLKDGHRKIQLWIKGTSHAMFPTTSDVLWLYWIYWNILNGDFCCNESLKWIPIPKHLWLQKRYQLQISKLWVLEIKHGGETWLHPRWHARNWSKQKTANVSDNPRQADKHTVSIGQYTLCSWFLHGFKWLYFVHGAFANHALKSHSPGSKPKIVLLRFHSWKWQSSVFMSPDSLSRPSPNSTPHHHHHSWIFGLDLTPSSSISTSAMEILRMM